MFVLKSPYLLWAGKKPSLGDLHPWDSLGHVLISHLNKLECKTILFIFVRYSKFSKWYVLVYEIVNNRLVETKSHDVDFFEFQYPEKKKIRVSIALFGMDGSTFQGEPTPPVGLCGRDPMDSEVNGSDQNAIRHCSCGLVPRKYIEIGETS